MYKEGSFSARRVLITGGLGFIGSNLAFRLVELGAHVTLVDSLIPEYGGNLHNVAGIAECVRINISDVRDEHSMKHLVQGQNIIFNLAGQTSHIDSMQAPRADLEINASAQLSILEACRLRNPEVKIVFASTRQLYGKPSYLPVNEQHPLRPTDVNGVNKMAGEWFHILYHNVYGLQTCALRLTNTYGPRMRIKDARQTFLGIWINSLLQGKPIEVWGGEQLRDFTYVDDAVNAFLLAAIREEANGQVYNLGGCEVVNLREVARLAVDVHGGGSLEIHPFPAERKRIDIGDYYADDQLIRSELGWRPSIALKEGLRRTLEYYRHSLEHYI